MVGLRLVNCISINYFPEQDPDEFYCCLSPLLYIVIR